MRSSLCVFLGFFLFFQNEVIGQIKFTIVLKHGNVYEVKAKPTGVNYSTPQNITNSSQITLVVPTGGFKVGKIQNFNGTWKNDNHIIAPNENSKKDYITFNLSGNITDLEYKDGVEETLFTFENIGDCTGAIEFIKESDPFYPPNSKNINIGNQISILGAGLVNAFLGTYGVSPKCLK